MEVILDKNRDDEQRMDIRRLTIVLNKDVELRIQLNDFGQMVVTKTNFGNDSSSILIEPHVSNQIAIS